MSYYKTIFLAIIIILILLFSLIALFGSNRQSLKEEKQEKNISMEKNSNQKIEKAEKIEKVAMIIAFTDFKDEEYFVTKKILENNGIEITTVSNKEGTASGTDGDEAKVDITLNELRVEDYNGIVFIGGPGCLENLDNDDSYRIATEAAEKNKVLGSICISPVILAKAGVLKGRKAKVWSSALYKQSIEALKNNGAVYQNEDVVADGNIITANGPSAAEKFGMTIAAKLKQ